MAEECCNCLIRRSRRKAWKLLPCLYAAHLEGRIVILPSKNTPSRKVQREPLLFNQASLIVKVTVAMPLGINFIYDVYKLIAKGINIAL